MKKLILLILILSSVIPNALSQHRIKFLTYNILNYPNFATEKNPKLQLIMNDAKPDIVAVQEIQSQSAVNLFLTAVLGPSFQASAFFDGPDTDNALYYKDSIFTLLTSEIIPNTPRYITKYVLRHNFSLNILIVYVAHFKAGDTPADETTRGEEAARLRLYTDQLSGGTNYLVCGDFNLYTSAEPCYERLLDQTTSGYFLDPLDQPGSWHNNSSFSSIHTQSTRTFQLPDGGASGGMDDRFDFILVSQAMMNFGGVDYVPSTYWGYGNDGTHFNKQLVDPPYPISQEIAFALHDVSDHLPIVAEFDFGVINGVEEIDPSELSFKLYQNYPNPFNPSTVIKFEVPYTFPIRLILYDILGREVKTLFEGDAVAGSNEVELNAEHLPAGVYFYHLFAENYSAAKKLVLLK